MRPFRKPAPKSKQKRHSSHLGDTDTDSSSERLASFRTPPRDVNLTDYNLDVSGNSNSRTKLSRTCKITPTPGRSAIAIAAKTTLLATSQAATDTIRDAARVPSTSRLVVNTSRKETTTKRTRRKQILPKREQFRKLMNRTDFMIPRAVFVRVVREIMMRLPTDVTRLTQVALEALQTAVEKYMENRFEDAYLLTLHARRVTLLVRDLELVNFLLDK